MVLVLERDLVLGGGGPVQAAALTAGQAGGTGLVAEALVVAFVAAEALVQTELGAQGQAFDGTPVDGADTAETVVDVRILGVVGELDRVIGRAHVGHTVTEAGVVVRLGSERLEGAVLVSVALAAVATVGCVVVADVQLQVEIVGQGLGALDRGIDAAEEGVDDRTVIVHVAEVEQRAVTLGARAHRQVVAVGDGGLQQVFLPVVRRFPCVLVVMVAVLGADAEVLQHVIVVGRVVVAGIAERELQVVQRIEHVVDLRRGVLDLDIAVVGHAGLALKRTLGRHDDDACGTAATVDGRGGGVLQDVDALDLVGRYVGEVIHRETIHEDERVVRTGDGLGTADADGRGCSRGLAAHGHHDAGHFALQSFGHVGHRNLQVFRANGRHGTGQVADLDGTVTDDHGLFEHLRVIREGDGHVGSGSDLLGRVADAGDLEGCAGSHADLEITVDIRHHAVGGTGDDNRCSDDRLSIGIQDLTLRDGLRIGHSARQEQSHAGRERHQRPTTG